jgi:ABC-type sugar transport system ATPase subunit
LLKVEQLFKRFGSKVIVDRVSFEVDSAITVIVGLNGSGKSTLLKVMAGIWPQDGGSVFIGDRNITRFAPEDRHVGYVPQHPALFSTMTVKENIRYCLRNGRGSEEMVERLIEMLELGEVLHQKADTLSGGFQSRVSMARALASNPQVMLLDEPLSDLDVAIKEKLLPQFKKVLKALHMPVVYVTHDSMEAGLMGDRFSVMVRGTLSEVNSAQDAFDVVRSNVG